MKDISHRKSPTPPMIPQDQSMRFFSGVRAIGYQPEEFVLSRRDDRGGQYVFVSRGAVSRRYPPQSWVEEALSELRAGVYRPRQASGGSSSRL
jgi:hypothetical protein